MRRWFTVAAATLRLAVARRFAPSRVDVIRMRIQLQLMTNVLTFCQPWRSSLFSFLLNNLAIFFADVLFSRETKVEFGWVGRNRVDVIRDVTSSHQSHADDKPAQMTTTHRLYWWAEARTTDSPEHRSFFCGQKEEVNGCIQNSYFQQTCIICYYTAYFGYFWRINCMQLTMDRCGLLNFTNDPKAILKIVTLY